MAIDLTAAEQDVVVEVRGLAARLVGDATHIVGVIIRSANITQCHTVRGTSSQLLSS